MKKILRIALIVVITIILLGITIVYIKKDSVSVKHNQNGLNHYQNEEYELALQSFENAIKWNKNWLSPKINLTKVLYIKKEYEAAIQSLDAIIVQTDTLSFPDELRGLITLKEGAFSTSENHFTNAINKDSLNYLSYYYRGICYANLNKYDEAISDYKKSKSIQETYIQIKDSTIIVLAMEDYSTSVGNYDKDVEGTSNFADAFYNRGYFKLNIDDLSGALSDFNKVVEIDNKYVNVYYYRGLANAKSQQIDKALLDFQKSIDQKDKVYNSMYNMGYAYFNMKELAKAKDMLSKMIKAYPEGDKNAASYNLLGTISLINGNYAQAIQSFNKVLEQNNKSADTYFNRAICYGYLKEHQLAIEDLITCYSLDMRTGDVHFARGVQYASLSKFREACYDFREAEKMNHPKAKEMINTYCKNN